MFNFLVAVGQLGLGVVIGRPPDVPVEATGEPLDDPLEDGAELWLVAVVAFDGELVAVVLLELQALTATSAITPSAEPATTYRRDPRERLALSIWCSDPSLCVWTSMGCDTGRAENFVDIWC